MKKFKKGFDTAEAKPMTVQLDVGNTDRAFGTIFGSEITAQVRQHPAGGHLPCGTATGDGGQSFGAFIPKGPDAGTGGRQQRLSSARDCPAASSIVYPPKDVTL